MRAIQFSSGTDLLKVATHIQATLRNLAPLETGLAQELLHRQEAHLAAYLEQYRQAEEFIASLDPAIAVAQAEVDRTTQLAKDAEAGSKKKPSPAWDAAILKWQANAEAVEQLESLKQRKLAAQSELESLGDQRTSIDASLVALRAEFARIGAFYSVMERKS